MKKTTSYILIAIALILTLSLVLINSAYADIQSEEKSADTVAETASTNEKKSNTAIYDGVDYSAVYDFDYYYNKYPDLQKEYGKDEDALLKHFVTTGMDEGRRGNKTFDIQSYYNANQDLRLKFGFNLRQYYLYYMENHETEERPTACVSRIQNVVSSYNGLDLSEIYDGMYYMVNNWDVYSYYTKRTEYVTLVSDYSILYHFVYSGIAEGRKGNYSDFWKNRKTSNWVSVENIIQYPELPSGCECVALTIALNHYGFNLGKTDIADYYMPYGDSFIDSFAGDPYMEGSSGTFPPGVVAAANNFLATQKTDLKAYDMTGANLELLYALIDLGYPVVVWTSIDGEIPEMDGDSDSLDGVNYYQWYTMEHCVVLYGYDRSQDIVYISDPNCGDTVQNATLFECVYDTVGRYAVVIK